MIITSLLIDPVPRLVVISDIFVGESLIHVGFFLWDIFVVPSSSDCGTSSRILLGTHGTTNWQIRSQGIGGILWMYSSWARRSILHAALDRRLHVLVGFIVIATIWFFWKCLTGSLVPDILRLHELSWLLSFRLRLPVPLVVVLFRFLYLRLFLG